MKFTPEQIKVTMHKGYRFTQIFKQDGDKLLIGSRTENLETGEVTEKYNCAVSGLVENGKLDRSVCGSINMEG